MRSPCWMLTREEQILAPPTAHHVVFCSFPFCFSLPFLFACDNSSVNLYLINILTLLSLFALYVSVARGFCFIMSLAFIFDMSAALLSHDTNDGRLSERARVIFRRGGAATWFRFLQEPSTFPQQRTISSTWHFPASSHSIASPSIIPCT